MFLNYFLPSSLGLGFFLLLLFTVLQWFQVSAGSLLDWVIGGLSFEWLVLITTVPWNIHFQAKGVIVEALESQARTIPIATNKLNYAQMLAKRSLQVAIALHLLSALTLYSLSAVGITPIGTISAAAALLLTGLRPAVRGYEYLAARLQSLQQEFQYPREDVVELCSRLSQLQATVEGLERQLNPESEGSWVQKYERFAQEMRGEVSQTQTAIARLRSDNASDHDRLAREASQSIAKLSEDSEFLNHARELIQFFKSA